MGRQYVHLSADRSTAEQVGRRKSATPVVLTVEAMHASNNGTAFWRGNELVWLADHVPAGYLSA